MKRRMIHAKQLDKITKVDFSYNDVTIYQDGALVVLDKKQILTLAELICAEEHDDEFYQNIAKGRLQ